MKPLMIIWAPVSYLSFGELTNLGSFDLSIAGSSFLNDAVDFVARRTKSNNYLITRIPIPFYFYERLWSDKKDNDNAAGFLLDSVSESIDLEYPETPSTDVKNTDNSVVRVRNTVEIAFRVKMNSTLVSVFRFLLKRMMTDIETAINLRFSFYWNEYVLSTAKCLDYNEAPIPGTNLTLIKMKLETFKERSIVDPTSATSSSLSQVTYIIP